MMETEDLIYIVIVGSSIIGSIGLPYLLYRLLTPIGFTDKYKIVNDRSTDTIFPFKIYQQYRCGIFKIWRYQLSVKSQDTAEKAIIEYKSEGRNLTTYIDK